MSSPSICPQSDIKINRFNFIIHLKQAKYGSKIRKTWLPICRVTFILIWQKLTFYRSTEHVLSRLNKNLYKTG